MSFLDVTGRAERGRDPLNPTVVIIPVRHFPHHEMHLFIIPSRQNVPLI
jgi:hypothetical protein